MKFFLILSTLLLTFMYSPNVNNEKRNKEFSIETQFNLVGIEPEEQDQKLDNKKIRSKNIETIESNIKNQQNLGKLKNTPLIILNKKPFTLMEFEKGKDTISILGKGKIIQITLASPMVEKMVRDKFNKPGDNGVLMIQISFDEK